MMKLVEAIEGLDSFDEGDTIFAAEPWTPESEAIVVREPDSGGLPTEAQRRELRYFIEVFIAREFLQGWLTSVTGSPTQEQKCARLIQYAITDA